MFHSNEKLRKALTVSKFYSYKRGFSFVFMRFFCVIPISKWHLFVYFNSLRTTTRFRSG